MEAKKETRKIKAGDFLEIDYTGSLKDEGTVFDTTKKSVAEKNNLSLEAEYKTLVICIGENNILPALEAGLVGQGLGKHEFDLMPDNAFGRKSAKLLKLVPTKVFKNEDIVPYPGLEVNIDKQFGIVRSASGGRVIVDFNHPLSGRDIHYEVVVNSFVTDDKKKLQAVIQSQGIPLDSVSVKEKKTMIVLDIEIPDEIKKILEKKAKDLIGIKSFVYVVKKKKAENEAAKQ